MANLLEQFRNLIPTRPLLVGTVAQVNGSECRVTTADGGVHRAYGEATAGQKVYFRSGGAIEGTAPSLSVVDIEI